MLWLWDHRKWQTNQNTAVKNHEVLCFRVGSVLPYRRDEIYSLNLLLESQGEKKKTERRAGHDERACLGGVRRRLVSVIPSRSARKDCPTHWGFLGQPSR